MTPVKEELVSVPKVWGTEIWVVNRPKYCGKLLYLDRGATSSYHYHRDKEETFYCLRGSATLTIESKDYIITPFSRPKTILPYERHKFRGLSKAKILEVSTHHDDNDVERISESIEGSEKWQILH